MKRYKEDQLDPPDVEDEEFYCRYTLEYKARKVDVNTFLNDALFPNFLTNPYASRNPLAHASVRNPIIRTTHLKIA